MKLFNRQTDDFAEVAKDPERRRVRIDDLARRSSRLERVGLVLGIVVVIFAVIDHFAGAICVGMMAMIIMTLSSQLKSDIHLLQVLSNLPEHPLA